MQVYNGLAGMFLVSDPEEAAAGLPTGAYDVPLVIQDRVFDANNQFVYLGGAGSMPTMTGNNPGGMPGHNIPGMGGTGGSPTPTPAVGWACRVFVGQLLGIFAYAELANSPTLFPPDSSIVVPGAGHRGAPTACLDIRPMLLRR